MLQMETMMTTADVRSDKQKRQTGRPRRFDTSLVLDTALELFWKKGFANTTTRDLENHLSLNQSSIYNAFGSKEKLFEMVLDRYENITSEALLNPLEKSKDGIEALERFFTDLHHWVSHGGRRGCMLINLMAEDGGVSETISSRTAAYRKRVKLGLKKAIKRAASIGDINERDTDSRTIILFGLALGINIAARGGGSDRELKELLNAVLSQISSWRTTAI
jgi:TetR/AcrR family transcriptional repressor of nem operon